MVEVLYKNIIFMKYGVHASESIESIIKRKMEEIEKCQKMFWGYGGVLCHPLNQVQPFLEENVLRKEKTYLLLSKTPSELNNVPQIAKMYSCDKINWEPIPNEIKVLGSKFAIVCSSIEQCDFNLDLSSYIVPVGNSRGRKLSQYIQGRVDKACGRYNKDVSGVEPRIVNITLCAEIVYPFSVFLNT